MALDFSDYLFHSDESTECDDDDDDDNPEPNSVSNTGNGCHEDECACVKLTGNQPKGICKDSGEPSSGYPCSVPNVVTDDYDGNVRDERTSSKRPSAQLPRSDEEVTSAQRYQDWKTGSLETLSSNEKLQQHPSKEKQLIEGVGPTHSSVGDLHKLLERLQMNQPSPEPMNPTNTARPMGGCDPDDKDSDRLTQRQPVYRSRRSLPGRLTKDHVTRATHETRKKNGRRGSVKFADDFGLNLNTFAMIPSRFSAQAHNDVNRHLHSINRKWNSDDRMSMYIDRDTATDGFRGMGSRWSLASDLASDLGRFLMNGDDEKTLWPDWDSHEFRSKAQSLDDDLLDSSNQCHYSSEKRSSKQERIKPETLEAEVAKGEEEADVNGLRHDFRLRFEQPFADLDGFQRKLRENFLCLENIRVDDRSLKNGDHDHSGTGPSRKRQGSTILCSIKVRHTDGGVGAGRVTVFSRCTDNEWVTHADLPAQHLSGVSSLGFDYDTFCFAVRKPVQPSREGNEAASGAGPTSAVEFALCCRVTTREGRTVRHWDNNDGANYRIEWFDD